MAEEIARAKDDQRVTLETVVTDVARAIRDRHAEATRRADALADRLAKVEERAAGSEALGARVALQEDRVARLQARVAGMGVGVGVGIGGGSMSGLGLDQSLERS